MMTRQVPEALLERICGMVYATRGEQLDQNYINHLEYARLVSLRHSGYGPIETVLRALDAPTPEKPQQESATAQGSAPQQSQQNPRQDGE